MVRFLILGVIGTVLLGSLGQAAEESSELVLPELKSTTNNYFKEVGMTVGTPGGLNVNVGIWGPMVLRASGMYLGTKMTGGEVQMGWALRREGHFKHYVGVQALTSAFDGGNYRWEWTGLGPVYGMHWRGLTASLGASIGSGTKKRLLSAYRENSSRFSPFEPTKGLGSVMGTAQIGYTFLF